MRPGGVFPGRLVDFSFDNAPLTLASRCLCRATLLFPRIASQILLGLCEPFGRRRIVSSYFPQFVTGQLQRPKGSVNLVRVMVINKVSKRFRGNPDLAAFNALYRQRLARRGNRYSWPANTIHRLAKPLNGQRENPVNKFKLN